MSPLETIGTVDMRWVLVWMIVAIDLWCMGLTFLSSAPVRDRVLWSGVILLCPMIGCMFWFVLGPKPDMLARERRLGRRPPSIDVREDPPG